MASTWGPVEERESQIAELRGARAKLRKSQLRRADQAVAAAFSAAPFTLRELRYLASQTYQAPVISLYLNFEPARMVRERPVYLTVYDSMRHSALEAAARLLGRITDAQRERMVDDLAQVERFLQSFEPQMGSRSLVLFKSGDQLQRIMALPVRTKDALTMDADPKVEPLEAILEESRRVLIVDVSKDVVRFATYWLGIEEEVDAIQPSTQTRHIKEEDRPGKDQRRHDTHVAWFLKSAARLAAQIFRDRSCDLVALVGDPELLQELEQDLPKAVRERILTRFRVTPEHEANERRARIESALEEQRAREEGEALSELDFFESRNQLVSGLENVLEPSNLFVIRRLFIKEDLSRAGFVCREHNFLALESGNCPFDGRTLIPVENLADELIEVARLQSADVMVVKRRKDLLEKRGGVAAVTLPVH